MLERLQILQCLSPADEIGRLAAELLVSGKWSDPELPEAAFALRSDH